MHLRWKLGMGGRYGIVRSAVLVLQSKAQSLLPANEALTCV